MRPKLYKWPDSVNRRKQIIRNIAIDWVVLVVAYSGAYSTRSLISPLTYVNDLPYIFAMTGVTLLALYLFGVYDRIWAQTSGHGVSIILGAVFLGLLVLLAVNFLRQSRFLPTSVIVMGNILALGGLVAVRYRSRLISGLHWRWRAIWFRDFPQEGERVLVIGAGESGQTVVWRIKHRLESSRHVIGFIDDDPNKQQMYVEGCPVLGRRKDIARITEEYRIDLIVVAIHNIPGQEFREILSYCEHTAARIKVVPNVGALLNDTHTGSFLRDVQPEDLIGRSIIGRHEAVDLSPVQNAVVLITGAAGSIGSELSRQMLSYNLVKLIVLDNNESALHDLVLDLRTSYPESTIIPALVDITVRMALQRVFEQHQPQVVFHAAAYKHVPLLEAHPSEAVRVNMLGTRNLIELAQHAQVERFVMISTDKAVKPSSTMGASKRFCELMLHAYCQKTNPATLFTVVRFGNVLGSRGSVVPIFNRQLDNGGPITVTHPEMTRYFMSIPEAVNLVIHSACLTDGDDIFVLQMGEVVRILDIAERMIRLRGLRPYADVDIRFIGIRPGEKMHEELHTDTEQPEPTLHPHIIRLSQWQDALSPDVFFARMETLFRAVLDGADVNLVQELEKFHVVAYLTD